MRKLSLVVCLVAVGCGNAGTDDPLTGTWKNDTCFQQPVQPTNVQACSTSLVFTSDLKFSLVTTEQIKSAEAVSPRCLTTHEAKGQTWSVGITDNKQSVTIAGSSTSNYKLTDCVRSEDNKGSTPDTISVLPGVIPYSINATTLTISSGTLQGTYTKQSTSILPFDQQPIE